MLRIKKSVTTFALAASAAAGIGVGAAALVPATASADVPFPAERCKPDWDRYWVLGGTWDEWVNDMRPICVA